MLKNTNGISDESEADLYSQGKSFSNSMCWVCWKKMQPIFFFLSVSQFCS
jgi:hypothetical protein